MTDPKSYRTPNPNELLGTRAACGKMITFAWIVMAITTFFALIAGLRILPDDRHGVIRYWFLIQTLFLIVVTFFMRRKSRVAFVLAMVYELVTLILLIFVLGELRGLPGSIFGVVTYFAGMLAAFRWHELDPEEAVAPPSEPSPEPSPGSSSEPAP